MSNHPIHRTPRRVSFVLVLVISLGFAWAPAADAAAPWDPDNFRLVARELAPNVFAVFPDDVDEKDHVGTTAGFVIGEKGVLVIESMLNGRLASQLIGLVRERTHKPIRYLVNTSYHGDHSYGNFAFPVSTTVIHHPATKHYIDTKFEADRKFMLGLMGENKGIEEVVPRSADITVATILTLDLGGRVAELRHFGFAQTPGDLAVWLPEEKVLWVGNALQAPPPAIPWLLEGRYRDTIATLQRIKDFLPADATIIPGHGRPMKPAEIGYSIEYLKELQTRVKDAVAQGLSAEQAVQRIDMSKYNAYSIYPFAHSQVNVPAVYNDLKAGK